jgi:hypothetical protein
LIGLEIWSSPERRYGSEPRPAAKSQVSETTRKPSRIPTDSFPRVTRSSVHPKPPPATPAITNGQTGSE